MHVMLDLETMGVRPDAAIVQIGAVLFEPVSGGKILNGQAFNHYVRLQDGAGTVDNGTVAWWLKQPKEARERLANGMEEGEVLTDVLAMLIDWPTLQMSIGWPSIQGVWANGAAFDVAVLTSAFAKIGCEPPWRYNAPRDLRTIFDLVGGPPEIDWTGLVSHDAVDDCVGQCMQLQKAMSMIHRV